MWRLRPGLVGLLLVLLFVCVCVCVREVDRQKERECVYGREGVERERGEICSGSIAAS